MEFRWKHEAGAEYTWYVHKLQNGNIIQVPLHAAGVSVWEFPQEGLSVLGLRASESLNGLFVVHLVAAGSASDPMFFWLLDDSALQSALSQAKRLADNPNGRYAASYINQLRLAIANAERLYATSAGVTPEVMGSAVEALEHLAASPQLAMTGSGFFNRYVPGWWSVFDFIATPFRSLQSRAGALMTMVERVVFAAFSF